MRILTFIAITIFISQTLWCFQEKIILKDRVVPDHFIIFHNNNPYIESEFLDEVFHTRIITDPNLTRVIYQENQFNTIIIEVLPHIVNDKFYLPYEKLKPFFVKRELPKIQNKNPELKITIPEDSVNNSSNRLEFTEISDLKTAPLFVEVPEELPVLSKNWIFSLGGLYYRPTGGSFSSSLFPREFSPDFVLKRKFFNKFELGLGYYQYNIHTRGNLLSFNQLGDFRLKLSPVYWDLTYHFTSSWKYFSPFAGFTFPFYRMEMSYNQAGTTSFRSQKNFFKGTILKIGNRFQFSAPFSLDLSLNYSDTSIDLLLPGVTDQVMTLNLEDTYLSWLINYHF